MTEQTDSPEAREVNPRARTTWEGIALWQFERTLEATPQQRLAGLEEAILLARAAGAIRRPEVPMPAPSPTTPASLKRAASFRA